MTYMSSVISEILLHMTCGRMTSIRLGHDKSNR